MRWMTLGKISNMFSLTISEVIVNFSHVYLHLILDSLLWRLNARSTKKLRQGKYFKKLFHKLIPVGVLSIPSVQVLNIFFIKERCEERDFERGEDWDWQQGPPGVSRHCRHRHNYDHK